MQEKAPAAEPGHATWSSRLSFFLSAMGAAVGLGSIWRFPYLAGEHGGAAFVLVFVAACLLVSIPILIAEFAIGRYGRRSPAAAVARLARDQGNRRSWAWVGWLGVVTAFLILTYYSVIAGWVVYYGVEAARGSLTGLSSSAVAAKFAVLLADPWALGIWHTTFMALTIWIVSADLTRGIELANKIMMPALFVLLAGLVVYALINGDAARGLAFAFLPDFSELTFAACLAALGQSFFAIGVGMGMMIMYGAYLDRETSLAQSAVVVSGSIIAVSVLASALVFPLVFAYGLDPAQGFELVFVTLPTAFAVMPGGALVATSFFVTLLFAALTSSIAALEPAATWLGERFSWSRRSAALVAGGAAWVLGFATVWSFNRWRGVRPLGWLPGFADHTIYDVLNEVTSDVMLPVSAIALCAFFGWRVRRATALAESGLTGPAGAIWHVLVRWVCPLVVLALLVAGLGEIF